MHRRVRLVRLGEVCCRSPEEFKAWSQNLGHDHVLTTSTGYGAVSSRRQAETMRDLRPQSDSEADEQFIRQMVDQMRRRRAT